MGVPVSTLKVKFKLTEFVCVKSAERGIGDPGSFRSDEPYLMVIFYKLDGDTLKFNSRTGKLESPWPDPPQEPGPSPDMVPDSSGHVGKPTKKPREDEPPPTQPSIPHAPYASLYVPWSSGKHKNIGIKYDGHTSDYQRDNIVRDIGEYNARLVPIPVVPAVGDLKASLGEIGCLMVLMEEDNTLDSAVAKGNSTLKDRFQAELTKALENVKLGTDVLENVSPNEATNAALKKIDDNMSWIDKILARGDLDDYVGNHIFRLSHTALVLRKTIPLYHKFESTNDGTFEIYGEVTAEEVK